MAAAGQKTSVRQLLIHTPDGKVRSLELDRDRFSLGRSSTNELCYADDVGLSRQHLALERDGSAWTVHDLGSKNGTFVNGSRITEPYAIAPNDRIAAGHLVLEFADKTSPIANTVVFVEGKSDTAPTTADIISLEHV